MPYAPLPRAFRPLSAAVAVATAVLLAGCAVGPDYHRPDTSIPAAFKEAPAGWKVAQPADRADRGPWWSVYNDPQLDALIGKLNASNQTIAQSAAAYRQARALVAEARAAYFPTVGLTASGSRARSGRTPTSSGASGFGSSSSISNSYSVGLDASWEPDLWGKVSRSVSAQRAGEAAAAADLANARLSQQALLAQTYFQLRTSDALQKLLDDTVKSYGDSLRLTQNQYAQGVAARADVIQAQTQLQSAQAAAIDNGVARAQYEHAIATLIGEPASTFSLPPNPLTAQPPITPVDVPSALLERRPDIAAAERRAASANEQIGVAIAAFFPTLTLSATGGFQSSVWSQLFTLPARFWTVGPQLAATLFDAGLRAAQTDAARATYDQDVAAYRLAVLTAFQDVEDNLASQRILAQEVDVQRQAVDSAEQALAIVTNQYKAGTVAYLNVLSAQTTAFTAQQKLATIAGQRMVSSVGLVKALGGGWDASDMARETGDVAAPVPVPASGAAAPAATSPSAAAPLAQK
ncbi:efflux transporter, outer membrane factor (OMF) lipo, NodT family protein [Burkholderia ambifaria AMMD]|uniref:RND efflux system, outer membrane lipoprotein, NodT family n=1 Tax=Burkholderia ambifaria (strain ATCC BAA-244 / DSM 16087 / CCUG 44356 / LMG 19182 / AMMD) TaxID=339670 RepID=Q0BJS2_BURCM|nr:efflux transporter outer membrane subunit [Burkholderia ambifaria]ABI85601.1 RND efflux system, outer membrane lipoprotein, NodT family [Burkholderia ambifaria AMMD]AJY22598.1 efflux transporter, outer membrane factor (OMF) lipo, NodT family protein [Burkholderia ambifaria AMMD]MBR7935032.1 efflux transporter outer membrane subunit [Burkholderia ambifaria]PEH67052.1 RND transporter [Burkholderia ambifaria]QQC04026.1 efflux transporter outer membrane subunit [Burkholderia ambifaria]